MRSAIKCSIAAAGGAHSSTRPAPKTQRVDLDADGTSSQKDPLNLETLDQRTHLLLNWLTGGNVIDASENACIHTVP
jgi:hypothetical protein